LVRTEIGPWDAARGLFLYLKMVGRQGFEPWTRGLKVASEAENGHKLLTLFLADRHSRNLSPRTIQFYQGYLDKYMNAVMRPVLEATKADVVLFLDSLTCSPGGKHAFFRAIRAFYMWAVDDELIARSPIDRMKAPKVPKPLRYAVPLDAIAKLLDACETVRDKLVVSLLADTGIRRAELAGIAIGSVDLPARTIRIWGKGAKERKVAYGPRTASLLTQYLESVEGEGTLLGLTIEGTKEILRRLQAKTGIKCNPHAFRRTFATESIRNGMNVFYVQSLLGHSSLTMTRIYAEQVNSEDAIKAYCPIVK